MGPAHGVALTPGQEAPSGLGAQATDLLQKTPRLVNLHNLILDPGFRMDEMRSKFREVACDLHREGPAHEVSGVCPLAGVVSPWACHVCKDGLAPAHWVQQVCSSRSLRPAANLSLVGASACSQLCAPGHPDSEAWSAYDPTFASACELAESSGWVSRLSSPLRDSSSFTGTRALERLGQGPRAPLRDMCVIK